MYLLGLQHCCFGTLERSAFLQASNWPVQGKNLHGNYQHTNTNTGHETLASSLCPHMLVMAETRVTKDDVGQSQKAILHVTSQRI